MKYAYLKLSLSLILAILFISCNKDDINNSSQINIEKNKYSSSLFSIDPNGYLIFNTPESYENALSYLKSLTDSQLDSLELSLNFISSYSYFNDKTADTLKKNIGNVVNYNKSLDDELLHRIINKNGMIQIDSTIFKLVSDSMLVYSMKSSYKNTQYSNFLSGSYNYSYTNQLNNESIPEEYNTVFEFVRSNPSGIKVTSQKPFKETPGGVTIPVGDPSGPTFRARTDIAYIKAVFYYSLVGKLHYEKKYGALWLAYNTNMKVSYPDALTFCNNFRKKGGSETSLIPTSLETTLILDNKVKWRPYEGGKKVITAKFKVDFYFSYGTLGQGTFQSTNLLVVE